MHADGVEVILQTRIRRVAFLLRLFDDDDDNNINPGILSGNFDYPVNSCSNFIFKKPREKRTYTHGGTDRAIGTGMSGGGVTVTPYLLKIYIYKL